MADSSRHLARQLVLQAIYADEIGETEADGVLTQLIEESGLNSRHAEFARFLLQKARQNEQSARESIAALAENWQLERLATIDRIIMWLAMTELKEMPDIPVKVAINEALELAKTFSTAQSAAFINGILDRFAKQVIDETDVGPG